MCKDCEKCIHYPICEWCVENADFKLPKEEGICEMFYLNIEADKPATRADLIRRMSNEELATEFAMLAGWDRNEYAKALCIGIEKVMLDWLKQPAEGELL